MRFKLIMALVADDITDKVIDAARDAGATGATTITSVRGEGLQPEKTFLGLDLSGNRDMILFLVVDQLAREIIEAIAKAGDFDAKPGSGIACQISIEDAVGLTTQMPTLQHEVEEQL